MLGLPRMIIGMIPHWWIYECSSASREVAVARKTRTHEDVARGIFTGYPYLLRYAKAQPILTAIQIVGTVVLFVMSIARFTYCELANGSSNVSQASYDSHSCPRQHPTKRSIRSPYPYPSLAPIELHQARQAFNSQDALLAQLSSR
jgi:hypothetical protein